MAKAQRRSPIQRGPGCSGCNSIWTQRSRISGDFWCKPSGRPTWVPSEIRGLLAMVDFFVEVPSDNIPIQSYWNCKPVDSSLPGPTAARMNLALPNRVRLKADGPALARLNYPRDIAKHKLAARKKTSLKTSRPVDQRLLLIACRRCPSMSFSRC